MEQKKHPDGIWNTTEYKYRGRTIMIKSAKMKGMKAHCFNNKDRDENGEFTKTEFTMRYHFINPKQLLNIMMLKIDKIIAGEWIPAKKKKKLIK